MNNVILDHLDLWTGAVTKKASSGRGSIGKVELTGVKKLREFILELALRGQLVPQSPEDTSLRELVIQLREDRAPVKTRGRKTVSGEVSEDEKPFNIPKTWVWTRLGEIVDVLDSQRKPITKAARKSGPYPYYGASGIVDYVDGYLFDESLVLVGEDGAKWDKGEGTAFSISGKTWVNNHAHVLRPRREAVTDDYLVYFLTAADLNPYITGMTVPKLNQARLSSIPVATPNLEEQHRIVKKVGELMALCDRLEQQTSDQLEAHETLVDTLLGTLSQSENATELAGNWARLAAHFDTLFTTEQSIDKLKQTILQLAVMGRLVDQDAGDEPIIGYLDSHNINATNHEQPGWAQVSLGDLGEIIGGATPSKRNPEFWHGEIPWVSPKDMKTDQISNSQDHVSKEAITNSPLRRIPPQSLLMVVRGMILAHSFPVAITTAPVTINQDIKALVPPSDISQYLLLFLKARKATVTDLVDRSSHGTCKLKSEKLWALPIDLPTIREQERILRRVDELMALCDQLKERLNHASETRCQLAEAVAEGALNK